MKYFIMGFLFASVGIPLIDYLTTQLSNQSELHAHMVAKQIYEIQKTMNPQEQSAQESKNPIGFATSCVGFEVDGQEEQEEE